MDYRPNGRLPRSFWRRWAPRIAAVFLVALCGYTFLQYRLDSRLRQVESQLDRDDPGWRLDDIEAARAPVPDAENSALVVIAVRDLLPAQWQNPDFIGKRQPNERLDGEVYGALNSELDEVAPALSEASKLSEMPRGRYAITYARPNLFMTLLTHEQKARDSANLLGMSSIRRTEDGDFDGALADCRGIINAGRSLGDEPLLISQLIRNACVCIGCNAARRVLARGRPSPAAMETLQKLLEDEDTFREYYQAMRGERAAIHEMTGAITAGRVSLTQVIGGRSSSVENLLLSLARPTFRSERPDILTRMTRFIDATALPPLEQVAAERALDSEIKALPRTAVLTRSILPAVIKVSESGRRKHGYVRCLIACLAVERFRRAHGAWPNSLDDLVPCELAAVPKDAFTDEPLRFKKLPDGVVIYSVGPDGKDDGGNLGDVTQALKPGLDIGYRLWDPELRGQPPREAEQAQP